MTSAKFLGFWTPSPLLSVPNPRNLPSFGQNLINPLPPPQSRRHMYMPPNRNSILNIGHFAKN